MYYVAFETNNECTSDIEHSTPMQLHERQTSAKKRGILIVLTILYSPLIEMNGVYVMKVAFSDRKATIPVHFHMSAEQHRKRNPRRKYNYVHSFRNT